MLPGPINALTRHKEGSKGLMVRPAPTFFTPRPTVHSYIRLYTIEIEFKRQLMVNIVALLSTERLFSRSIFATLTGELN